jgi:hypothetical protein
MQAVLTDPASTGAILVTLPESMPVSETLELNRGLRDVIGMQRAALVLNGFVPPRFSEDERSRLARAPIHLAPLARAALVRERRALSSERWARRLSVDVELAQIAVPFLFTRRFGRSEIERIADLLECA